MAWKIKAKSQLLKFIDEQDPSTQDRIKKTLKKFIDCLDKAVFPFAEMNIKKLHGKRKGHFRLRAGDIRIILKLDTKGKEMLIKAIDYRGDVYKR